jgi:hypothetical protein
MLVSANRPYLADKHRPLARKRVTVLDYPDGRLSIQYEGRELPYRTFDKLQKVDQAAIVENKRLGEVLAYVAERQMTFEHETLSTKAARRNATGRTAYLLNPRLALSGYPSRAAYSRHRGGLNSANSSVILTLMKRCLYAILKDTA